MGDFLALDYPNNPFVIFGVPHLVALAIIAVIVFALIRVGPRMTADQRKWFRYGVGTWLIINELSWHWWNWATGQWTVQTMLPLHLCSVLVWLCAYMLVTKNRTIYEFAYLIGIAGALQAVLTPDLGQYAFPHFRYFQVFLSHGLIIISALYMTLVEGYRPTWSSVKRVAIYGNIYFLFGNYFTQVYAHEANPLQQLLELLPSSFLLVQF